MKLSLTPLEIPFLVGDTVWVAQSCGSTSQQPYFQGRIIQIILDGSLMSTTVIRHREEIHELVVSSAVYDLKPIGDHTELSRVSIDVPLSGSQKILFKIEKELLDHQNQPVAPV